MAWDMGSGTLLYSSSLQLKDWATREVGDADLRYDTAKRASKVLLVVL
jgi:hypothetical protein